jgi:hypothetical protein
MGKPRTERRHLFERLDDRRMLAVITVTALTDGSLSSLAGDGKISLREAVEAANLDISVDGSPTGSGQDEIRFDPALFASGPQVLSMSAAHESTAAFGLTALRLSAGVNIVGPGAEQLIIEPSIEGEVFPRKRLIRVDNESDASVVDVAIRGVTLRGGELTMHDGSAILNRENLTLTDVVVGGYLAVRGGGIASSIGRLTLNDSRVEYGNSGFGGGIYVADGSLTLENSRVEMGSGTTGGGVYIVNGNAELRNSSLAGNGGLEAGGGLYARNALVTIVECEVTDNGAQTGGGIAAVDSTLNITDSVFERNNEQETYEFGIESLRGGGVAVSGNSELTVVGGTFAGNAAREGGGVYVNLTGTAQTSFTNVEFVDNVARSGGGIWFTGSEVRLSDSNLRRNLAIDGSGGGFAARAQRVSLTGGTIEENSTESGPLLLHGVGGGAWLQPHPTLPAASSRIEVLGVAFQRNTSVGSAGGLAVKAEQVLIRESRFLENTTDGSYGGGIVLEAVGAASTLVVEESQIKSNRAGAGGGVYATAGFTGTEVDIADNEAEGSGGGVYSRGSVTLLRSTVRNNRTHAADAEPDQEIPFFGGGVYAELDLTVRDSEVRGNVSTWKGGGLGAGRNLTVDNSDIVENRVQMIGISDDLAGQGGGGLSAVGAVNVTNSRILRNVAAGVPIGPTSSTAHMAGGGVRGGTVVVVNSTVTGNTAASAIHGGGGGIWASEASITDSVVSGNYASLPVYGGGGGFAGGRVTILRSVISQNRSEGGEGGGGLWANSAFIHSSALVENVANSGGAAARVAQLAEVVDSRISGNTSTQAGGGLYVGSLRYPEVLGSLRMIRSTVSSNTATREGGGVWIYGVANISESTISGNATENSGGGVLALGTLIIERSLVTANRATRGGGIAVSDSWQGSSGAATIRGSIVSGNSASVAERDLLVLSYLPEHVTTLTMTHTLVGHTTGNGLVEAPVGAPDASGNLIGGPLHGAIDARLGSLADRGGPTPTHNLLPNSPAMNAGNPTAVAGAGVPLWDQRGANFARIVGGRIDMGPYERQPDSADFNADGLVDGADFLSWQRGVGSPAEFAIPSHGDANDDAAVDGRDLAVWRSTFGAVGASEAAASDAVAPSVVRRVQGPAAERLASTRTSILSPHFVDLALTCELQSVTKRLRPRWQPSR